MSEGVEDGIPDIYWKRRPAMNQEEFDKRFGYKALNEEDPLKQFSKRALTHCCRPFFSFSNLFNTVLNFLPVFRWIPKYSLKRFLLPDIIGGFTVAIMHVPQGIAYASLASVPPVVGLYMSFLAPLFYMFLGTSKHASLGSFAVVSLMAGMASERLLNGYGTASETDQNSITNSSTPANEPLDGRPTHIEIASMLTFAIGVIHILMGVFRLQFLATYFSDQVVAGFTTAASLHVLVAQLKEVFIASGRPKRSGAAQLLLQIYDILSRIHKVNGYTVAVSIGSIIFLLVGKELINPFIKKKRWLIVPIPFELILIIIATVLSALLGFNEKLDVKIVNNVPAGFPSPSLPRMSLFGSLLVDAFGIGMVIVAVHISMAKMFAKKKGYKIDAGQELYAIGLTSVLSSFFPVYPISCSLGRTVTNVEIGTETQLSALFSSALLIAVITFFGQYLASLPMCVLSSIIIVALKGMFKKFSDLKKLWPVSKIDFAIWLVSFLGTVVIDVKEGLLISIVFALITTVFRTQWSRWHMLSNLKDTNDYRDSQRYQNVINYEQISIFRFDSPLLFTNVERFKKIIHKKQNEWKTSSMAASIDFCSVNKLIVSDEGSNNSVLPKKTAKVQPHGIVENAVQLHFIIDCSGFTFVDYMGINALKEIFNELRSEGTVVYFASAKAPVRELFACSGFYKFVPKENFYPTIRDAVNIARQRRDNIVAEIQLEQAESVHNELDEIKSRQPEH